MKKEYPLSPVTASCHDVSMDTLMPLMLERLAAGQKVQFAPRGVSMLPMLRQGRDCVILSPVPEKLKKYDLPLYRLDSGKYLLHRVVRVGQTYSCRGDNLYLTETGLRHDQMLALVTGFTRDGKLYSVGAWPYRLYCRIWYYSFPLRKLGHRVLCKLGRWRK